MVKSAKATIHKGRIAEILYMDLPETKGMTYLDWIKHFEIKGILVNDQARKLLRENLIQPTVGLARRVAIISMKTEGGPDECSRAKLMEEVILAGLDEASMETMCLLRDMNSEQGVSSGVLLALYPHFTTHGDECLMQGMPQWLGICENQGVECLDAGTFGFQDKLKTNAYYVYEVPVK